MKKKLFVGLIFTSVLSAEFIDGISVVVNRLPITTLDVAKTSRALNVNGKQATNFLIEQKVIDSEVTKQGVYVSDFDVELEMESIAKQRGYSLDGYKTFLAQNNTNYEDQKEKIRANIKKRKLYKVISDKKLHPLKEQELRQYYDTNLNKFSTPKKYKVIQFSSKSKKALVSFLKTGRGDSRVITRSDKTYHASSTGANILNVLKTIPEKRVSPISKISGRYTVFYMLGRIGQNIANYEDVRQQVYQMAMQGRQGRALREYFEKQKAEANIDIIREIN